MLEMTTPDTSGMASSFDALKIYYIVTLATDDPHDVTPFQGFSTSWEKVSWALELMVGLPADVLERTITVEQVIALRMGGVRPLAWSPFSIKHLNGLTAPQLGVFVILFSGEKECAEKIAAWAKLQSQPVLHVSSQEVEGACKPEDLTMDRLQAYCIEAFRKSPDVFTEEQRVAAEAALGNWIEPPLTPSGLTEKGHNITRPNYMVLRRAARSVEKGAPFIGRSEREYTDAILESARAVVAVREQVGLYGFHYMTHLRPELILTEPALYRLNYRAIKADGPFEEKVVAKSLRWLQTQKGLCSQMPTEYALNLTKSPTALSLIAARAAELDTFTRGVGLRAAQTTSAVVRLSPGVNHVFPSLSAYARSLRSTSLDAKLKTRRLFDTIQNGLATAVGAERIAFIKERQWPVKIVSDAPIEWLSIGNLPLAMRYDCSRINATPGNLLMGLLLEPRPMAVHPDSLVDFLVVSSFADDDPLKDFLKQALEVTRGGWEKRARVSFKSAKSKEEFIDVLNSFEGAFLIFDGHGANNANEPVGKLMLGREAVDVWELHRKVRVPPIVILSACDTQGIDASSHATVGNGFLFLGALTVLATLLPVGGLSSAAFISRLVYRIADFVPSAIAARRRALNWTEVVSGMLRRFLASEILDALVGPPEDIDTPRGKLLFKAGEDIDLREDEHWFDNLLDGIAENRGQNLAAIQAKAQSVIARAEAIRYIQLGNPELIIIDDGKTRERLAEDADALAAHPAEASTTA
jgi:CHAT domain-containing protein